MQIQSVSPFISSKTLVITNMHVVRTSYKCNFLQSGHHFLAWKRFAIKAKALGALSYNRNCTKAKGIVLVSIKDRKGSICRSPRETAVKRKQTLVLLRWSTTHRAVHVTSNVNQTVRWSSGKKMLHITKALLSDPKR